VAGAKVFMPANDPLAAIPGRSFSSVFVAPFHLFFRKASRQNSCLAFLF
jgi:hypothetical protein